ncbi:hypothetical protein [Gallaecimonas pentaromativorans]|uniref:Uncharacterized protein n=1 Tax=Gallaecimonas pentaromativorans TaxID=584787 RepID=A0A3N1NW08_9GAMM|nr:hypothetical protein [Gallaecimonas pentaromativorans]ROQ19137.1 hypothetical protein EDC28_11257 [Gallaecimonas pentaromativorans]
MTAQTPQQQQLRLERLAQIVDEPGLPHRALLLWSLRTLQYLLEEEPVHLWDEDRDPRRRSRRR